MRFVEAVSLVPGAAVFAAAGDGAAGCCCATGTSLPCSPGAAFAGAGGAAPVDDGAATAAAALGALASCERAGRARISAAMVMVKTMYDFISLTPVRASHEGVLIF